MKKYVILLLSTLLSSFANAQFDEYKKSSRGVSIECSFEIKGMSAGQIYSKVLEYVDMNYGDANSVTKNADNINNVVIFSGYYPDVFKTVPVTDWGIPNTFPLGKLPVDISHHVKVSCTDNSVLIKISVDDYVLCRSAAYVNAGCYQMRIPVLKCEPFGKFSKEENKKAKLTNKAMSGNPFVHVDKKVKEQIEQIVSFIEDDF